MSNIYIQEPPTHGKVLLETTVGDIDIELWARECPKACRNFIQLCMEGYYNGTIFHRLVKGFIVQGGDPTGTGTGGNSVYGKPFKDEFHSRLRFMRRGLVGMANAGRDDNASQFFFTLGQTPELQNKHTLFGKVTGNTIYNMLKLEEGDTDSEERPLYPHKITGAKILMNPFEDIVPRETIKREKHKKDKPKESGTKNYKLLSFGEEAEEEEEEVSVVNQKYSGKSKSSHDLANDPKLSKELAVEPPPAKKKRISRSRSPEDQSESRTDSDSGRKPSANLTSIKEKLQKRDARKKPRSSPSPAAGKEEDDDEEEYYLGKDEDMAKKKKLDDLKKEYRELKSSMRKSEKQAKETAEANKKEEGKDLAESDNAYIKDFVSQQKEYKAKTAEGKKKGADREALTLALLSKFQKKLETVKDTEEVPVAKKEETEEGEDEDDNDTNWLKKTLDYEGDEAILAKDANLKTGDWYALDDPRNPAVQRRRYEAERAAKNKDRHRRDLI